MLAFARRAHLELSPDAPQDGWLGVHSAISGMKAKLRTDRVASLLEIQEKDERDAAIKDETERWEADAFKLLKTSMREFCGYTGSSPSRSGGSFRSPAPSATTPSGSPS